jgi:hypothetical protein
MNELPSESGFEDLDRESVVLRLGVILRRMKDLIDQELHLPPLSVDECREQFRNLSDSWEILIHKLGTSHAHQEAAIQPKRSGDGHGARRTRHKKRLDGLPLEPDEAD